MSELQQLIPNGDRSWLVRRSSTILGLLVVTLLPLAVFVFVGQFATWQGALAGVLGAGFLVLLGLSAATDVNVRPVMLLVFLPLALALLGFIVIPVMFQP